MNTNLNNAWFFYLKLWMSPSKLSEPMNFEITNFNYYILKH